MARIIHGSATILLLLFLAGSQLLSGCQTLTGQTLGENIDDASVTAYVKAGLGGDKMVNLTRISVQTTNGIVHLAGVVTSDEEKARAEEIARGVRGVKDVVNNLQVRP